MDGYKEFKGKTLDSAIEEACRYFNSTREKLEIEFINDAKTGIFGLVGAKKAKIKARRMQVQFDSQTLSAPVEPSRRPKKSAASVTAEPETERKTEKPKQPQERPKRRPEEAQSVKQKPKEKSEASSEEAQTAKPKQERGRSQQRSKQEGGRGQKKQTQKPSEKTQGAKPARKKHEESEEKLEGQKRGRNGQRRRPQKQQAPKQESASAPKKQRPASPRPEPAIEPVKAEPIPEANLDELDQEKLLKVVTEVVTRLITPVIGETPVESYIEDGRVKASISSGDNSGLLIGREGQTLASFQYLANRIVAKIFGVAVRVQLDTGDYRERQDDKLRDIALHLAEKAKNMGKPQSTRPLSSYHRRVVHLVLQDDEEIQTRSKGDGPLKRVIISRKRK